jgi:hypothetical protein
VMPSRTSLSRRLAESASSSGTMIFVENLQSFPQAKN